MYNNFFWVKGQVHYHIITFLSLYVTFSLLVNICLTWRQQNWVLRKMYEELSLVFSNFKEYQSKRNNHEGKYIKKR